MRSTQALSIALIGCFLAQPAQAKDAACQSAITLVDAMTATMPIEVDAVTKTTGVEMDCDTRRVELTRAVELKQSRMNEFRDYLQKQDNESVCPDKSRRALVDAGWQWITTYTFQDGEPVTITVKCAK